MLYTEFNPYKAESRPCWHCRHFAGMLYKHTAAHCLHPLCTRVRSEPQYGCAQWERQPFADDSPDPPEACSELAPCPTPGGTQGAMAR